MDKVCLFAAAVNHPPKVLVTGPYGILGKVAVRGIQTSNGKAMEGLWHSASLFTTILPAKYQARHRSPTRKRGGARRLIRLPTLYCRRGGGAPMLCAFGQVGNLASSPCWSHSSSEKWTIACSLLILAVLA